MGVVSWLVDFHDNALEQWGDRRVDNFLFMGSIWGFPVLVVFYLYVSLSLGPRLMKNRKPFNITPIIVVYNIVQGLCCAWLVIWATVSVAPYYNFVCAPLDRTVTPRNWAIIKITHIYLLQKIADLMETIFFVMKKSWRQITFLHLYHHASLVIVSWIQCRFLCVGISSVIGHMNSFVHIFMYLYYTLAVFYERSQLAWLRQRTTELQMAQFAVSSTLVAITTFNPNCYYPKWLGIPYIMYCLYFMYLFSRFYYNTYVKARSRPNELKTE